MMKMIISFALALALALAVAVALWPESVWLGPKKRSWPGAWQNL